MRYYLYAVEKSTGFTFEREVYSKDEYNNLKESLTKEGYHDFYFEECYSDLDEMYADLA